MTRNRFCLALALPFALALAAFSAPEPAVEFIHLSDTHVTVHDGVKPGDQVILNPMIDLADGSKVAVRSVSKTRTS